MLRLKTYMKVPNGDFWFEETVNGVKHTAERGPIIDYVAHEVKEWRKGNGYPRATFEESLSDVDQFMCVIRPTYCYETKKSLSALHPGTLRSGCRGCGAKV